MQAISASRQITAAMSVVAIPVAVVCGLLIGQGEILPSIFMGGLIVGCFLFLLSTPSMVLMTLFFTFVIQGSIQFYGKTGVATWAAFGLSALILVKMAVTFIGRVQSREINQAASASIAIWLAAYLCSFCLSFVINAPPIGQTISAFKNALPALGILFAIGWGNWEQKNITRLWWLIVVTGLLQLLPVVHQHFFVAAARVEQGWDSVVGTMGGSQDGGGLNAMLVLVSIASMIFVLARHKRGLLSLGPVVLVTLISLAVMLLGEVKAVFIWLPVALALLYWRAMLRNPSRAIAALAGFAIVLAIVFSAYQALYWEKQNLGRKTFSERIEKLGGYFFDADQLNYRTGEISRIASISLWLNDAKSTPLTRVFGYGPGASKSVSVLGQGEIAYRYAPLNIDSTTIAAMLWDIGLIGFLSYAVFLILPIFVANRLLKKRNLAPHVAAEIETAAITLLLMSSLLIYNRTLVDQIVTQALAFLSIGTIVFHARNSLGVPQNTGTVLQ